MSRSVVAFFLGGTISMAGHGAGVVARLGAAELLEAVPALADVQSGWDAQIEARDFRRLPSACLTVEDVLELVDAAAASGADGVVVVQGTDTIEETAFLIDLVWDSRAPVVVTGAMRNPTLPGADGPANLLAAVQVAASGRFDGLGALVAFNDQVHAARWVRKTHSTNPATFASPSAGPVGVLVEGQPVLLASLTRRPVLAPRRPVTARVPIMAVGLDEDASTLSALAGVCDGLVVSGFGAGHVPQWLAEPLGELAARVPVVLASRTGAGAVLSNTYGFAGSESDLLARGLIGAGLLDPYKARVLLRVALACGYDRFAIGEVFAEYGGLG